MTKLRRFSAHKFSELDTSSFSVEMYSKLKYGSVEAAYIMGEQLAQKFFDKHSDIVMSNQLVVAESAYALVRNAASLLTEAFTDKLNQLSISFGGHRVHRVKINRDIPYITDYGKLTRKARERLLKADRFTLDYDYIKGKFLLLIDDSYISGAHHRKLEEMLESYDIDLNDCMGLYFAELESEAIHPKIESELNSAFVRNLNDLDRIGNCIIVVRTLKLILGDSSAEGYLKKQTTQYIRELYKQALREGYYKVPQYSKNFSILQELAK